MSDVTKSKNRSFLSISLASFFGFALLFGAIATYFPSGLLSQGLSDAEDPASGGAGYLGGRGAVKLGPTHQAPRTEDEQQMIDIYKRMNKAVVNVSSRVDVVDFFGAHSKEGTGSGVVINARKGYVVTNFHVIQGAGQILVTLASGQSYGVDLIGQDPGSDLALLQVKSPPVDLTEAELGDSSSLEVGQRVFAIGNPFGLSRTLSKGIVSSLGRTIQAQDGRIIEDIIQIDAAINPGNSGGPLLDSAGRVVGLNTAILSSTGESAGIGFAVPANTIRKSVPQFIKYGKVLRPKIGAIIEDTDYGPVLIYVQPGGPADKAGLEGARKVVRSGGLIREMLDFSKADFLIAVDGKEIKKKADVIDLIGKADSGKDIEITVKRGPGDRNPRKVKVIPELG